MLGMLGRDDIIAGFIQFCKGLYYFRKNNVNKQSGADMAK